MIHLPPRLITEGYRHFPLSLGVREGEASMVVGHIYFPPKGNAWRK
nr:hypothetical protein [Sphingomonas populi]